MAVTDLSVLDPVVKEHYSPFELARMAMQKNKATGMLAKSQKKTNAARRRKSVLGAGTCPTPSRRGPSDVSTEDGRSGRCQSKSRFESPSNERPFALSRSRCT